LWEKEIKMIGVNLKSEERNLVGIY
jgi:hypothetical protein